MMATTTTRRAFCRRPHAAASPGARWSATGAVSSPTHRGVLATTSISLTSLQRRKPGAVSRGAQQAAARPATPVAVWGHERHRSPRRRARLKRGAVASGGPSCPQPAPTAARRRILRRGTATSGTPGGTAQGACARLLTAGAGARACGLRGKRGWKLPAAPPWGPAPLQRLHPPAPMRQAPAAAAHRAPPTRLGRRAC